MNTQTTTQTLNAQQQLAIDAAEMAGTLSNRKRNQMLAYLQTNNDLTGFVYVKHVAEPKPARTKRVRVMPIDNFTHICMDCYRDAIASGADHEVARGLASHNVDEMAKAGVDKNGNQKYSYCKTHNVSRVMAAKKIAAERQKAATLPERIEALREKLAALEAEAAQNVTEEVVTAEAVVTEETETFVDEAEVEVAEETEQFN